MTYRILVTDDIDAEGVALLAAEPDLAVDEVPTLPRDELLARIGMYDALVGRSATRISPELLRAAPRLAVVGRAGVGVDNIAVDLATEMGIAVINAPAGNSVAVAELFFGTILGLLRHIPQADQSMHAGAWDRSALMGSELRGRTLGIVGLGRIGGEIAARAHAFAMPVVAYDPYVGESRFHALRTRRAATLDELLGQSLVLTVHTPLTDETRGMIGARELGRLAPGAIVANLARGGIIDERALADALGRGSSRPARRWMSTRASHWARGTRCAPPRILILTPHIGASTVEAQRSVAVDVCRAVRDALLRGELSRSINAASADDGRGGDVRPALMLARQLAAVGRALLATRGARAVDRIDVSPGESLSGAREALLAAAALGVLAPVVAHERLNLINARALAAARGIALSTTEGGAEPPASEQGVAAYALSVRLTGGGQEVTVAGLAHPATVAPRITGIGAFDVDIHPRGTLLILTNRDVPGVIGRVGTVLGAAGVNIAEYHQARLAQGGEALAAVAVDGAVGDDVRHALLALPDVHSATVVPLPTE